jgi:hypothetical protein
MRLVDMHSVHIHPIDKPPLLLRDLDIIPTHLSLPHPPVSRKSPVLKPVASLPLRSIRAILILVPKLHGNLVVRESEELFAQAVGLLFRPLGCQEVLDGGGALQEVRAVAPDAVGGVGFGYRLGVSSSQDMMLGVSFERGWKGCWEASFTERSRGLELSSLLLELFLR